MSSATANAATKNAVVLGSINLGGRPRGAAAGSERTLQPWAMAGVSPRTYYRRKMAARSVAPQQNAHVMPWLRSLPSMARLDFIQEVRHARLKASRDARVPASGDALLKAYRVLRGLH